MGGLDKEEAIDILHTHQRYRDIVPAHEADGERREVVKVAEDEIVRAIDAYNLPIEPDDVHCYVGDTNGPNATAAPYECEKWSTEGRGWRAEGARGYIIVVAHNCLWKFGEQRTRAIIRHELAHIMGWETEGVTYEQTGNHAVWLEELDGDWA